MAEWRDVTNCFSEEARHYNGKYMEVDEVYDEAVEVSVFSAEDEPYEIYFSYGYFYGIVYSDADKVYALRDEMKKDLESAYNRMKEPDSEYINWFSEKYRVCLPNDIIISGDPFSF